VREPLYAALEDGREVAYRVLAGPPGPVFVHPPTGMVPIEVLEDDVPYERVLRALGRYGTVIVYDSLGKGASDPFDPDSDFYDEFADAFVAVLDASRVDAGWLVCELPGGQCRSDAIARTRLGTHER
jgi:pimeloyl-ACP methyl ester carboxylesterase